MTDPIVDPRTWADLAAKGGFALDDGHRAGCGCRRRPSGALVLCPYHEGYDDALLIHAPKEADDE